MAVEDKAYEELVQKVNALLACGRERMARKWLLDLAYAILRHYGYDVAEAPPEGPNQPGAPGQ